MPLHIGSHKPIQLHLPVGFRMAINFYQVILYPPVTELICPTKYTGASLNYALNDTCTFAAFLLFFLRINMPLFCLYYSEMLLLFLLLLLFCSCLNVSIACF